MFRCSRQNYLPTTGIVGILMAMPSSLVNAQGIEKIVVTAQKREQSLGAKPERQYPSQTFFRRLGKSFL